MGLRAFDCTVFGKSTVTALKSFIIFRRLHGDRSSMVPESDWPFARRLWSGWAGGSGSSRDSKGAQPSTLPCRKVDKNDGNNWNEHDTIEILLVEDSPGDVRLTREAFKDAKVHINFHVALDGQKQWLF
jgi:hypothetical protein